MPREIPGAERTGRGAIRSDGRSLAVVTPTLNGGARFRALIERLARQEVDDGFQWIVVDSGSNDGTAQAAHHAGAHVEIFPKAEFNHGRTRNLAIERSDAERIVLLTQDALPKDEQFLATLSTALAEGVDGVFARQVPRSGCDPILRARLETWNAARDEPARSELAAGDAAASRARFDDLAPMERYRACAFDNVASCIRRSTWERIPFPERAFGEDVAWAREVLLDGGRIAFEPRAVVEHSHRISIRREFRRLYLDHRNLSDLFGLRTLESWGAVFAGARAQRRHYAQLFDQESMGTLRRAYWKLYARPYALAESCAQFLGARAPWKARGEAAAGPESSSGAEPEVEQENGVRTRLWSWLDRKMTQ